MVVNKKMIWGGVALLLFSFLSYRIYGNWKATQATGQRPARSNVVAIEAGTVKRSAAQATINVTGSVQGIQEANISVKATGRIESLIVNDGDYISKGQLIAKIDSTEIEAQLLQAGANSSSAQANFANAARNYERMQTLVGQGAVSQQQLDSARTQYETALAQVNQNGGSVQYYQAQLSNTTVVAPFSGFVARKALSQGEMVSTGAILLAIVDLSKVKIEAFVSEQDIGKIQAGLPAVFTVDAYPNQTFTGTVTEVSPAADPKNRSFKIRIEAQNPDNKLKSGMFARADIVYSKKQDALVVPKQAVLIKNEKPVVFVIKNDQAEQRDVVTGLTNGTVLELVSGVQEGETVATFGHDTLKNGDKVAVARKGGK